MSSRHRRDGDEFNLEPEDEKTHMAWVADVRVAGPIGSMGQRSSSRSSTSRSANVLNALEAQVAEAKFFFFFFFFSCSRRRPVESTTHAAVPHRRHAADDGAARGDPRARPRDGRGRLRHDLARRGVPVVAEALDGGALVDRALPADRARDRAAGGRLGDHLAVHAPPDADRDGGAGDAGGGRRGALLPRPRRLEDLHASRRNRVEAGRGDDGGGGDHPRHARRRRARPRRQGLLGAHPGAQGRRGHAALGRAALLRRHRPDDAARRGEAATAADRVDHDAAFVRYVRGELEAAGRDPTRSTSAARSSPRSTRTATQGRDGAREIAGMYLANKVQNIQGAADTLLECAA